MAQLSQLVDANPPLAVWYDSGRIGHTLKTLEAAYLNDAIRVGYRQVFLQVGAVGWEGEYWNPDDTARKWLVAQCTTVPWSSVVGRPDALPLATESIDVLLLPHTLEFERDQHQVLREAERVLKPEGVLHILGFNPCSIIGLWRHLPCRTSRNVLSGARFIGAGRVLDWLSLLNFEAELAVTFTPAAPREGEYRNREVPAMIRGFATAYAIRAIKRRYRLIPLGKRFHLHPCLTPQSAGLPTTRGHWHD